MFVGKVNVVDSWSVGVYKYAGKFAPPLLLICTSGSTTSGV
jgi:hypothetical protein